MPYPDAFWLKDSDARYTTVLSMLQTFLYPEVDDLEVFQEFARLIDEPEPAKSKSRGAARASAGRL